MFQHNCIVIHGAPYLLCTTLSTKYFYRHHYAYVVEDSLGCEIIKISDLLEPHTFGLYKKSDEVLGSLLRGICKFKCIFDSFMLIQ
jgi:hypothetical protein